MKTLNITIDGEPQAQKRWRMSKSGHAYDPSAKDKRKFADKVRQQLLDMEPCKEEVWLSLCFYLSKPKKYFEKYMGHVYKPDLDNLIKFVLDACNGVLWEDDKIITSIAARKHYLDTPGVIIQLEGK